MAEPIEWALAGEAVVLGGYALEGLGLIGTAAEAGAAGGLALETASAGAGSIAALDAIGGTALVASETVGASEAAAGLGAAALAANTLTDVGGAATVESFFQAAAAEVAADAAIPTVAASEGLTTVGVVGAQVGESTSLVETATSIASKIPSAGTVGKTVVGGYATGNIASRLMSGDSPSDALAKTAGDLAKVLAKGTGYTIEELLENIDPSILVLAGVGTYFYLIR